MKLLTAMISGAMVTLLAASGSGAQHDPVSITVTVDTSKPGPAINRNIYGQFTEHLGRAIYDGIWVGEDSSIPNIRGYRKDVVQALQKLHVTVRRGRR